MTSSPLLTSGAATEISSVLPAGSRVNRQGHLEVAGCDLVEVAAEFGTPAYVVDEDDLRRRARAFLNSLRERHRDSDVLFASKAFPSTPVLRVLREEGLACDVASGGELTLALAAGFDPERVFMHGNAKSAAEVGLALEAGVGHVVLDSLDDLERVARVASSMSRRQDVLLRVNPDVSGDTHAAISTGQADSKFGFSAADLRGAVERIGERSSLRLVGLHCHIGSQLLDLAPFGRAVRALAAIGDYPVYNLGGGLGVAYLDGQAVPTPEAWVSALVEAAQQVIGVGKRLLIEPGRALVANSGLTLYSVETVKRNVSTWVAVDGGMSDNLRPMLYGSRYEALMADRPRQRAGERCHLVGKHCESGDVMIHGVELPDPVPGDVIVTPATGAYGYAMANNYNAVPRPPVVFLSDGGARLVVRRETYADLMSRDV